MGPPPDLCSTGALRAVGGASKWSISLGLTWLEGGQGPNYIACQCKYAFAGALQFFSAPHTFLSVLFS